MVPIGTVAYSASNTKQLLLNGLDSEQEIRTLRILLVCAIVSTAAAFAWALGDYATLAKKMATKIRVTMDNSESDESLSLIEWRTDAIDATGRDPFQEFLRIGDSIPATGQTALTVKIPVDINYTHEALDTPNLLTISSDQVNAGSAKVEIDWNSAPGNVVFANGTGAVTMADAKVQMDWADAHSIFVGPHWTRKSKGATAQYDLEGYPAIELLLAQESTPATFEASVAQVLLVVDDRATKARNIPPSELAQAYGRSKVKAAGDLTAIDVTNNTLAADQGAQISPLRFPNARVRAAEYELPFFRKSRKVEFPSGTSFAYQFLRKATMHIVRQREIIAAIMGNAKVGGTPGDLRVRGFGGGDNDTLSEFKGRIVKLTGT